MMIPKNQQFLIRICPIFVIFVLLYVYFGTWNDKVTPRINFGDQDTETDRSSMFLIDLKCMENLENNLPCRGPLKVASSSPDSFNSSTLHNAYRIMKSEAQNYILLVGLDDKHEKRAIPAGLEFHLMNVRIINQAAPIILLVPANIKHFRFNWIQSRYLECLGLEMGRPKGDAEERAISLDKAEIFERLRLFMESREITVFLVFGTLLGWFRECTIIPHTTDFDFSVKYESITEGLIDEIVKEFKMKHKLGNFNDSLELTFYTDDGGPSVDIFTMYSLNETHDYLPLFNLASYDSEQCIYPAVRQICSAGMHGYLVRVPCNAEEILTADYGPKWMVDIPTDEYGYTAPNVRLLRNNNETEFEKIFIKY